MASSKAKAKFLLQRANTVGAEAIQRNKSVKLEQNLFLIHFENRTLRNFNKSSTDQTNSFHYDHISQCYKFALEICTPCGPIFKFSFPIPLYYTSQPRFNIVLRANQN